MPDAHVSIDIHPCVNELHKSGMRPLLFVEVKSVSKSPIDLVSNCEFTHRDTPTSSMPQGHNGIYPYMKQLLSPPQGISRYISLHIQTRRVLQILQFLFDLRHQFLVLGFEVKNPLEMLLGGLRIFYLVLIDHSHIVMRL